MTFNRTKELNVSLKEMFDATDNDYLDFDKVDNKGSVRGLRGAR